LLASVKKTTLASSLPFVLFVQEIGNLSSAFEGQVATMQLYMYIINEYVSWKSFNISTCVFGLFNKHELELSVCCQNH